MCTGAEIGLLAASAGLTGLSAYNQNQALKKQDAATAAGIRQNALLQQQANARVNQVVQQQAQSNPAQITADRNAQYLDALRQNQQLAQQRLLRSGLGQAYAQRAAANQGAENDYAQRMANLMAQADAPGLQRQQEAFNFGDLGTDIGVLNDQSRGNQFVTGLKVKGIQPNPLLGALAQGGQTYLGMLGRGGGG